MKYEHVTKTATETKSSWSNKDKVRFHYFNDNGLIAKKRILDEKITRLVDEGKCKSGAHIAYGSLNYFNTDQLYKLLKMERVNEINLYATLKGIKWDIEKAEQFISEHE